MAEEMGYDNLVRDLTALGGAVETPRPSDGLATAVMERVVALPAPRREGSRWPAALVALVQRTADLARSLEPRRRIALVATAVLLALLAAPPVRATVAEWFGFAGVLVEREAPEPGTPEPGAAPPPPAARGDLTVAEAAAEAGFPVYAPAALGVPDGVEVSPDRRLVSMSWSTEEEGVLRLDQFDGRLDFSVAKTSPDVTYAAVGAVDALWFDDPHEVVLLDADGGRRRESARLAGNTLIWPAGPTTLRLEGDVGLHRAVEIAESARPVP